MRALICDDYGGIDALRVGDLPDPDVGADSVLVDVKAVAVNFADTLMVSGNYQFKPATPFAPGYELAGTVVQAPAGGPLGPGDRVCGFTWHGGMAERAVLAPANVTRLDDGVPFEIGAVIPATYGTSYHALVDRADLAEGETLLVLGAAGGVGMAAVQIGKALGARVIAAVSTAEKETFASSLGADAVIRTDNGSLRDGIASHTGGEGVDVVFDTVGGDATEPALRSTRWGGRVLVIGFAAGPIPSIPMNLPLLKGSSLVGVFWGRFTTEEPDKSAANASALNSWISSGTFRPHIQKTYPLEEGGDALRWVAERRAVGRVVVTP